MRLLVPTLLAIGLAFPAAAGAENGWEAKWLGQSEYPTLESGDVVTSFFDAQNVGSKAWTPANALLGTSNPRDRTSAFAVEGSWHKPQRALPIDREVPPGQTGRFTFPMRAPQVTSVTKFREYFEPVADDPADNGWMGNTGNWSGVFLEYTVLPPEPPAIRFSSTPSTVDRGAPIDVVATASDNRGVARVDFSIVGRDGALQGDPRPDNSYAARLDSAPLPPGNYTLLARAHDVGGRTADATTAFTVREAPPPPATDRPPSWVVAIGYRFDRTRGGRLRVRRLVVARLARDAKVAVRCRGRGCRFGRRRVDPRGRRRVAVSRLFRRARLRTGTRIVLKVSRPGRGAKAYTFVMPRRGKPRLPRISCFAAGGRRVGCG